MRVPKGARRKGIIFGMFFGAPLGHSLEEGFEPTRIELYKESFERVYGSSDEIKRQVIITVIHEVAHYLGFSEDRIRKLGYG
jgi:predicted Zn-dependent protease with MMP-like domain